MSTPVDVCLAEQTLWGLSLIELLVPNLHCFTNFVERGFSKMNAIKTALRNRLGSVLIHLLGLCISHALRRFQDLEIQKSLRAHDVSAIILQRNCLEK